VGRERLLPRREVVIALLVANAQKIIRTGERTWLRFLGIEPEFWSRIG
jgi:hypothetical protein